jgi:hypothetical protein
MLRGRANALSPPVRTKEEHAGGVEVREDLSLKLPQESSASHPAHAHSIERVDRHKCDGAHRPKHDRADFRDSNALPPGTQHVQWVHRTLVADRIITREGQLSRLLVLARVMCREHTVHCKAMLHEQHHEVGVRPRLDFRRCKQPAARALHVWRAQRGGVWPPSCEFIGDCHLHRHESDV